MDEQTKKRIKDLQMEVVYYFERTGISEYPKIIESCDKIIKLGTEEDRIWAIEQKADAYYYMKDYKNALKYFTKLQKLYMLKKFNDPEYYFIGRIYSELGEYKDAFQELTNAIKQHPAAVGNYIERAKAAVKLRRYAEAKDDLKTASSKLDNLTPSVRASLQKEIDELLEEITLGEYKTHEE